MRKRIERRDGILHGDLKSWEFINSKLVDPIIIL